MVRIYFVAALGLALLAVSCQKELAEEKVIYTPTEGRLLYQEVYKKADTIITTSYGYDQADRIISQQVDQQTKGNEWTSRRVYKRDALGRISQISEVSSTNGYTPDSSFTTIFYPDNSTRNFLYTVVKAGVMGVNATDSTIYTYDNNNRLTSATSFLIENLASSTVLQNKTEYGYDQAGNLAFMKKYETVFGSLVERKNYDFTYADATNPLTVGNEFVLYNSTGIASGKMVLSTQYSDMKNATDNYLLARKYVLGKSGKPLQCTETQIPGNTTAEVNYYYK